MNEPQQSKWKVDRSVPLALIFATIVQTGGFVWWAASLSARVDFLEKSQVTAERAGRIEEKVSRLGDDISEMKTDLKALLRKQP
jgi:hypothetical protein